MNICRSNVSRLYTIIIKTKIKLRARGHISPLATIK